MASLTSVNSCVPYVFVGGKCLASPVSLILLSLNALAGLIPFNLIPFCLNPIKLMKSFMIYDCDSWSSALISALGFLRLF